MDIKKVIEDLQKELARIDEAILTLERLEQGTPRRGRPPGWLAPEGHAERSTAKKIRKKSGNQK